MTTSAEGVSGMFTIRRLRLFGRKTIARLPSDAWPPARRGLSVGFNTLRPSCTN